MERPKLQIFLWTARGVTRNPKLAMEYYKIAADNGIASASFALGEYYAKTGNRGRGRKSL